MRLFPGHKSRKKAVNRAEVLRQTDIPAEAARLGMHVVSLDRPWTEVPLLFQSFVIDHPDQIAIIQNHCHWITVERTSEELQAEEAGLGERFAPLPSTGLNFAELRPLAEELPDARQGYLQAQNYIDRLLDEISRGSDAFDFQGARSVVRTCMASLANNANAMFWLSRIRNQDRYTAEHCVRVGVLAMAFGQYMGLQEKHLETVGLCGMLHDVGKMQVPPEILNKPGSLTPEEWETMRRHANFGFELLNSERALEPAIREAALSHHERLDGKGYPRGQGGMTLSRFTRMVTIVDAYDAMTSDRAYRSGIPTSEALRILYKNRGNQFDGKLVETFIRMIGIYPPGSLVALNTGETAIVLATSSRHRLRPVVELVLNAEGRRCEPRVLNLGDGPLTPDGQVYNIVRALPDTIGGFDLGEHISRLSDQGTIDQSP